MEGLFRFFKCMVFALLSLFAPVKSVICCTLCFVLIDFITGVAASRAVGCGILRVARRGERSTRADLS